MLLINSQCCFIVILFENPLFGELVLPDFDQSNLKTRYDGKYTDIAVACGLYFLSGMQGYATCEYRLMLMKHWPNGMAEVSEVLAQNRFFLFNFIFV